MPKAKTPVATEDQQKTLNDHQTTVSPSRHTLKKALAFSAVRQLCYVKKHNDTPVPKMNRKKEPVKDEKGNVVFVIPKKHPKKIPKNFAIEPPIGCTWADFASKWDVNPDDPTTVIMRRTSTDKVYADKMKAKLDSGEIEDLTPAAATDQEE